MTPVCSNAKQAVAIVALPLLHLVRHGAGFLESFEGSKAREAGKSTVLRPMVACPLLGNSVEVRDRPDFVLVHELSLVATHID